MPLVFDYFLLFVFYSVLKQKMCNDETDLYCDKIENNDCFPAFLILAESVLLKNWRVPSAIGESY